MKLVGTDILDFDLNVEGEHKLVVVRGDIKQCVGCFGCWVKTPGKCVICDGYENNSADMGRCDEYIIVSKCCYGSFSPNIKKLLDRSIGYVHPDFELRGTFYISSENFFGFTGILMFLAGGVLTVWVIAEKLIQQGRGLDFRPVTEQPLFYLALLAVILGFQLFLAGFICEMISRNSQDRNHYNIKEEI